MDQIFTFLEQSNIICHNKYLQGFLSLRIIIMLYKIKTLLNKIQDYKTIYIIGNGIRAKALRKFLESVKIPVKGLLNFESLNQLPSFFIENLVVDETIFIFEQDYKSNASTTYFMGKYLRVENDYCNTKNLLKNFNYHLNIVEVNNSIMNLVQRQLTPQAPNELIIQVNISDHCNLNCKMCTHFSPISQKEFYSFEQYKKDIAKLGELFDHNIGHVILMGGEPLLNPQLEEYIKETRSSFPKCHISVHTNGILLPNAENLKSGNLWLTCKEYDVGVTYTIYPLKIDYKKIEETAKKYGVRTFSFVEAANINEKRDKMLSREPLSTTYSADPEDYIMCYRLNTCTNLRDGKIFSCPTVAYINKINDKFGLDFKISESDFIDIYKVQTPDEICNFISHRIPFCRNCQQKINTYEIPWQRSKQKKDEWICDDKEINFEYHFEKLKKSQEADSLIVFGESELSISFVVYNGLKITCFVDNDKCKQGKISYGVKIFPVEYILSKPNSYILIISNHFYQMKKQVIEMNISEDKIIDGRVLFKSKKLDLS